jgi:hypothetical protein
MSSIIIKDSKGRFWTGSSWSSEYPDAMLYQKKEALKVAERLAGLGNFVWCIVSYGDENEKVVG